MTNAADRERDKDLFHWRKRAARLVPRAGEVMRVATEGFWFIREGEAKSEFMAWPIHREAEQA